MGRIPPPIPPLFGTDAEKREQLTEYRDHLLGLQSDRRRMTSPALYIWLIVCFFWIAWGLWKILWGTL